MEKKDKIFLAQPRFHKFVFNDQVASVFDDMVARSIPFYDEIHAIILDLVDKFYVKNCLIYDLGCSTGTTISLINSHLKNQKKSAHFVGIDNSQSMLLKCLEKMKKNKIKTAEEGWQIVKEISDGKNRFVRMIKNNTESVWKINEKELVLEETEFMVTRSDGTTLYNGEPKEKGKFFQVGHLSDIHGKKDHAPVQNLSILSFIDEIKDRMLRFCTGA